MKAPEEAYRAVFENNRRWVTERTASDPEYFARMSGGQNPDFLFIGCSDSRVPANVVMGLDPGDVFVHRNIANLVVNTDMNAQSVIQYAVDVLGVRHVVVCGHTGCGGVKAAMQPVDLGLLNGWLREIRDVYRENAEELDEIADEERRYRRLIELNVATQCRNLIKTSWVQKNFREKGIPRVHGWVYEIESGQLNDLEIPFDEELAKVRQVYDLG